MLPPAMARARELVGLQTRYERLDAEGNHLAASLFTKDSLTPRTAQAQYCLPITTECAAARARFGTTAAAVVAYWHDAWATSGRAGDVQALVRVTHATLVPPAVRPPPGKRAANAGGAHARVRSPDHGGSPLQQSARAAPSAEPGEGRPAGGATRGERRVRPAEAGAGETSTSGSGSGCEGKQAADQRRGGQDVGARPAASQATQGC